MQQPLHAEIRYTITPIALSGQTVPGQTQTFKSFSVPILNSQGQVAFSADFVSGNYYPVNNQGIYFWSGVNLARVADVSMTLPQDSLMPIYNVYTPMLIDSGEVFFTANAGYQGGGGYKGTGGGLTRIASIFTFHSTGTQVPIILGRPSARFQSVRSIMMGL